jgi:hypothetical protein
MAKIRAVTPAKNGRLSRVKIGGSMVFGRWMGAIGLLLGRCGG